MNEEKSTRNRGISGKDLLKEKIKRKKEIVYIIVSSENINCLLKPHHSID